MIIELPNNVTYISDLVPAGNLVFFKIRIDYGSHKLWKTDGTAAGTNMVLDIDPSNTTSFDPSTLFPFNNCVYFKAGNSTHGVELWKSDGTSGGTVMIKDIHLGPGDGVYFAKNFAILNNELYFEGGYENSGLLAIGLWKTDGTESGTKLVKAVSVMTNLTCVNDLLYFYAFDEGGLIGNSLYGQEIWRSDGTSAGTYMVKDIKPGTGSGVTSGTMFKGINGKIVFAASDGTTGLELWASDGTSSGTQLIKDIYPGTQPGLYTNFNTSETVNGYLYFMADDGDVGLELWATDGTPSGTFLVSDLYQGTNNDSSPSYFYNFNGNVFFTAQTKYIGREFWSCGNSTTSISETEIDRVITIFPNPTQDFVRISTVKGQIEAIQILDVDGKTLSESTEKGTEVEVNISHLNSGVYLVEITTENGTAIKRFVKE
jgi:ELWxxDGT repeat protein